MKFNTLFFLMLTVFIIPSALFAQKKIDLKIEKRFELDSLPYLDDNQVRYQINGDTIYYASANGDDIKIFKKIGEKGKSILIFNFLCSEKEYFLNFAVSDGYIYILLYFQKLLSFPLKENFDIASSIDAYSSVELDAYFKQIFVSDDKIVLTKSNNSAAYKTEDINCPYLVLTPKNLVTVVENKLKQDAIGLSHLSGTSYYDANYGKIIFFNGLHKKAFIYDLKSKNPVSIIDDGPLNEDVDSLPFSTQIIPYTNAQEIIHEIIDYTKKIDYLEYGTFLNDSTLFFDVKEKGNSYGKRVIYFYRYDKISKKWNFFRKTVF